MTNKTVKLEEKKSYGFLQYYYISVRRSGKFCNLILRKKILEGTGVANQILLLGKDFLCD